MTRNKQSELFTYIHHQLLADLRVVIVLHVNVF